MPVMYPYVPSGTTLRACESYVGQPDHPAALPARAAEVPAVDPRTATPDPPVGPPPGRLRELPSPPCTRIDLGDEISVSVRVITEDCSSYNRDPVALTINESGRFVAQGGEVGCADPIAARAFVAAIRALPRSTVDRIVCGWDSRRPRPIRVSRRVAGRGVVEESRDGEGAYHAARQSFLARSPSDAVLAQRRICGSTDAPLITFESEVRGGHDTWYAGGDIRADGWFRLYRGSDDWRSVAAGRLDPADVQRAWRWLRARGWDHVSTDQFNGTSPRSVDGYEYNDVINRLFGDHAIDVPL